MILSAFALLFAVFSVAYSIWAVIVTGRAARQARANLEALRAKHAADRAAHAKLIASLEDAEGKTDAR